MDTGSTVITSTGKLAPEIQAIYDNRLEKAKELDRLWSNYGYCTSNKINIAQRRAYIRFCHSPLPYWGWII